MIPWQINVQTLWAVPLATSYCLLVANGCERETYRCCNGFLLVFLISGFYLFVFLWVESCTAPNGQKMFFVWWIFFKKNNNNLFLILFKLTRFQKNSAHLYECSLCDNHTYQIECFIYPSEKEPMENFRKGGERVGRWWMNPLLGSIWFLCPQLI